MGWAGEDWAALGIGFVILVLLFAAILGGAWLFGRWLDGDEDDPLTPPNRARHDLADEHDIAGVGALDAARLRGADLSHGDR